MKIQRLLTVAAMLLLAFSPGHSIAEDASQPTDPSRQITPDRRDPQELREKWESLNPEEKARILERYREWKRMRPEMQQRIKENMRRLQEANPKERERLFHNLQRFESMSPDHQERLMQNYNRWKEMDPEKRRELRDKWEKMNPEQRHEFLSKFWGERPSTGAVGTDVSPRERFEQRLQQVTPEKRERILNELKAVPPEKRQEFMHRVLNEGAPKPGDAPQPPQKMPLREMFEERLHKMPPEKRERILGELRALPAEKRDEFIKRFMEERRREENLPPKAGEKPGAMAGIEERLRKQLPADEVEAILKELRGMDGKQRELYLQHLHERLEQEK